MSRYEPRTMITLVAVTLLAIVSSGCHVAHSNCLECGLLGHHSTIAGRAHQALTVDAGCGGFTSTNGSVIRPAFAILVATPCCMAMVACHHYSRSCLTYGAFASATIASPIWGTTASVKTVANCTPAKRSSKANRQRSNQHRPRKPRTGKLPRQRDFGSRHDGLTVGLGTQPRPGWYIPVGAH